LDLANFGKDLRSYLNQLEQVVIDLLSEFGIVANRFLGQTGVWAGTKKIASIGIGVRKWVSFHGLAVNVNTDLKLFSMIKPCGLDVEMTSQKK
jgi:lipoate-protein ligase B